MDAADAEWDDRLHPGALRQGPGSARDYGHHFVALARLPMNRCETLRTCFILGLAGAVRSRFDCGDLPQTLEEAICLAQDFEATGPLEPAPSQQVMPRETSPSMLNPISSGPRNYFSSPSHVRSPDRYSGPGPARPSRLLPKKSAKTSLCDGMGVH